MRLLSKAIDRGKYIDLVDPQCTVKWYTLVPFLTGLSRIIHLQGSISRKFRDTNIYKIFM